MTSSSSAERIAALRAEALRGLDASSSSTASAANNTAAPSAADVEATRAREAAVSALIDALVAGGDAAALAALFDELKPLFAALPKAKTAKLVRGVIEAIAKVPGSEELQLRVCREQAAWARAEKRTFLRQRLDARLAGLLLRAGDVAGALRILSALASEVKRLDDKLLLVDVHLLESRAHRALRDLPKARATLTAARAAAASTYVPPAQQAELDAQSGTLHADERDYRTAFSYFYEAFDALAPMSGAVVGGAGAGGAGAASSSGAAEQEKKAEGGAAKGAAGASETGGGSSSAAALQHRKNAASALKHMLLCKVMMGDAAEVPGLVAAKAGTRFAGRDVDALSAVAAAHAARSLSALDKALADWREELEGDDVVKEHVGELHDALLRRNLLKLVEPYSRVEVSHLAAKLELPVDAVVAKLSEMILDGAVDATLDAGAGCLEVFEGDDARGGYAAALEAVSGLGAAVDALFARSRKLSAAS